MPQSYRIMIARYIYSFIIILISTISVSSQASNNSIIEIKPKSLTVHIIEDNSVLIVHQVETKQTLYSIAKFYGTSVDELYKLNQNIVNRSIHPGDKLIVSIPKTSIEHKLQDSLSLSHIKMIYRIQPKETLYGIAHRSFNMSTELLMNMNKLENSLLEPGDYITVGWLNSNGVSPIDQAVNRVDEIGDQSNDSSIVASLENINRLFNVQNIAYWHKHQENTSGLYVLHKKAKVNSWIEVKNPMFGTSVNAKVIGNLPKNTYPDDIDLIVSAKVANQLGIIDARFYVEVSYILK